MAINRGDLSVFPFDSEMIQPSSIDVRLHRYFRVFDNHKHQIIDPAIEQENLTRLVEIDPQGFFILHPGEFVLASTYETVGLKEDLAARFEGKSSLGRLGLLTHITAGFIDPGFCGHITLELANVANLPIKLYPGMKIGQLAFFEMTTGVSTRYGDKSMGSHYQNQVGPTASRSFANFHQTIIPE